MPSVSQWLAFVTSGLWIQSGLREEGLNKGVVNKVDTLEDLVAASHEISKHVAEPDLFEPSGKPQQGILIAAGGADQLANALATVQVLRDDLGCALHIEVIYCGKEEADDRIINILRDIPAVTVRDAEEEVLPVYHSMVDDKPGYFKKILAIYITKFEQFLYLDADNLPLFDPTELFEWSSFKDTGSVFWSDYMESGRFESVKPEIYEAFGLEVPWFSDVKWRCSETGQMLLDKRRHADVLDWLLFLNTHHRVTYKYMYGDKDTFELAFALAGKHAEFNKVPYGPRASFKFLPEVSGTKFRLDSRHLHLPEFATLGLSIPALDATGWSDDHSSIKLVEPNAILPDDIQCHNLDQQTVAIVRKHDYKRWRKCKAPMSVSGVPLPLIPLTWFTEARNRTELEGGYVVKSLTALTRQFYTIQLARYEAAAASQHRRLHKTKRKRKAQQESKSRRTQIRQ